MKFIVGIGNPGTRYKDTRHNIGFRVIDAIKKASKTNPNECLLVKPSTFVNKTGEAVRILREKHRFHSQDLLVVCDDVNLVFGKLRLRASGSSGGHHGLESIIETLGSDDFPRLRIGVGSETMPKELSGYVLEPFSAGEEKELSKLLEKAVLVCDRWVKDGVKPAAETLSRLQSGRHSRASGNLSLKDDPRFSATNRGRTRLHFGGRGDDKGE